MPGDPCERDRVLGTDYHRRSMMSSTNFRPRGLLSSVSGLGECFQDYRPCILAVVLGSLAIGIAAIIFLSGNNHPPALSASDTRTVDGRQTCVNTACVETAARISEAISRPSNPCDNFYRYACDGWINRTHLDVHSMAETMNMDNVQQLVRDTLRDLLDTKSDPSDPSGFNEARHLYRACRRAKDIANDDDTKAFLDKFIARFGGYLTGVSNARQVGGLVHYLATIHVAPWFVIDRRPDMRTNYTTPIFHLRPPGKDVTVDYYHRQYGDQSSGQHQQYVHSSLLMNGRTRGRDDDGGRTKRSITSLLSAPPHADSSRQQQGSPDQLVLGEYDDAQDDVEDEIPVTPRSQQMSSSLLIPYLENQEDAMAEMSFARTLLALGYGTDVDEHGVGHQRLKEASKLLRQLRKLTPTTVSARKAELNLDTYNLYSLRELDQHFPVKPLFSWRTLLDKLANGTSDSSEMVFVHNPNHLRRTCELLRQQSLGTVRDTLLTHFLKHVVADMVVKHDGESSSPTSADEHKCVDYVETALPSSLAGMFVNKTPIARVRAMQTEVQAMWETLKETIEETLPKLSWLGPAARADIAGNMMKTRLEFGAADYFWDRDFHEAQHIRIKSGSFLEVYLDVVFNAHAGYYATLRNNYTDPSQQLVRSSSHVTTDVVWRPSSALTMPFSVNAFYVREQNAVVVPLGFVLDTPYFAERMPAFVKFGSLVHTLAHELIHALEHRGQHLDMNGNKVNRWPDADRDLFNAYATCFSAAYTGLFENVTLKRRFYPNYDAAAAFPDNLGDALGIDLTVYAYRKWIGKQYGNKDLALPSLASYSSEQLLMVQSAQMSCMVYDDWWLAYLLDMDEHTPAEQRVNGQMLNSVEFSTIFDCPVGTPMNPAKARCR